MNRSDNTNTASALTVEECEVRFGKPITTSILQIKLEIGYNHASRILKRLDEVGLLVTDNKGNKYIAVE